MRDFYELLCQLGRQVSKVESLEERELVTLFFEKGFFSVLGYGAIGEDVKLEKRVERRRVDVLIRGVTGRPICVIEFKRPGEDLSPHLPQLEGYVKEVLPEYATLTNGNDFWLYVRHGEALEELGRFVLAEISERQAEILYRILHKQEVDWRQLNAVREALRACQEKSVRVTSPDQEGGKIFLQQFELSPRVTFGRLANALYKVLPSLLRRSKFTHGAFAFWEKIYARPLDEKETKKLSRAWEAFVGKDAKKEAIHRFMFALETAYAIFSRLMLAKAMHDVGFPLDALETFEHALDARDRRGILELEDYIPAIAAVFEEGKRQAFRSLFESDIFDWWHDLSELEEMAREACEALAETALAVFQFDFSGLSGDLLGQLYQSYFDPGTRKALGEFYTPPEVVEFILDQVGYRGPKVLTQRLLDPACGSGTFLVHALKRYLEAASGRDPREVLSSLVEGFRIVGFDINPFAVLMSQVNVALHLLPIYAEALERDKKFEVLTLPVFRTDSLRQEKREGEKEELEEKEGMQGFVLEYKGNVAWITTELPVEIKAGKFLEVRIPVPRYDRARDRGWVSNVEEYFRVQHAMFEAVRESRQRGQLVPTVEELRMRLARTGLTHADELARYIRPSIEKILERLDELKSNYGDGRFLKTLEDLALAMTLKHELQYDYVVGNPPYVRIQNIPELSRRYWHGIYEWAEGNFDIFIPFIERAVNHWLKEGGKLGFICSNRFLLANYAHRLRERLPEVVEIELILDMRDTRVFKDALNYPAILIVKRTDSLKREGFIAVRVFADPDEGPLALLDEAQKLIGRVNVVQSPLEGEHLDVFIEQTRYLAPQGWYLMPSKERRVFNKLEKAATHRLHELTLTQSGGFAGYQTSADNIFVLKLVEERDDVLLLRPKGGGDPVEIEKKLLRPWLFGRNVERWHIAWDDWYVLFPYVYIKVSGEYEYKLIPCEENKGIEPFRRYANQAPRMEDFPKAWEYLNAHKEELRKREDGRFVHDWYGAARPQNLELYEKPKIVLQINSQLPDIAYDGEIGFVFQAGGRGGGVYGIALDTERINPWFMLALLNSSILDFVLKHIAPVYTGRTYSYSDAFIKNLPIRLPQAKAEVNLVKKLVDLAQTLTETKGKLRAKERERAAFPGPQLKKITGRFELYPLARLIQGVPQARQIDVDCIEVQPHPDGSWEMAFGRTRLTFPSEPHVRVAHAWLVVQGRRQVSTEEFLNLKLPTEEHICAQLLDLLEETEREISRLKSELEEGEAALDELVAELYKLGKNDRKVIRDFLRRF